MKTLKQWRCPFPILKTLRIVRKWWSSCSALIILKVVKKWRSPFFNVKNVNGQGAVIEFFLSFKSFKSHKKVMKSFLTLHPFLVFRHTAFQNSCYQVVAARFRLLLLVPSSSMNEILSISRYSNIINGSKNIKCCDSIPLSIKHTAPYML